MEIRHPGLPRWRIIRKFVSPNIKITNMDIKIINKALNETFQDRRNTISSTLHLLLSLAAALTAASIPLALVQKLSPGNRICLAVAAVSLFLSLCSGILCLILISAQDCSKIDALLEMRKAASLGQDVPDHIMGGKIKPLYICLGISALCFVVAIASLSACVFQILFA